MYSSSLVCITGNYWLAAGSRSLRDLEQGPGRFATFRGRGVPVASRPRGRGGAEHDEDPAPRRIKPLTYYIILLVG
jgi:hypothetical protein